jgi:hypothetical protein
MPRIVCWRCGYQDIYIDAFARPFNGEIACQKCQASIKVEDDYPKGGITATRAFPSLEELTSVWGSLTPLEQSRLIEASHCLGVEANTMCESACFDSLCSMLRRIYGDKRELGYYIDKMKQDPDLSELAGAVSYFSPIRNKVDHPDKISNALDAESTFTMTKRLILGIIKKKT